MPERVDVLVMDGVDLTDVVVAQRVSLALERLEGVGDVARVPVWRSTCADSSSPASPATRRIAASAARGEIRVPFRLKNSAGSPSGARLATHVRAPEPELTVEMIDGGEREVHRCRLERPLGLQEPLEVAGRVVPGGEVGEWVRAERLLVGVVAQPAAPSASTPRACEETGLTSKPRPVGLSACSGSRQPSIATRTYW